MGLSWFGVQTVWGIAPFWFRVQSVRGARLGQGAGPSCLWVQLEQGAWPCQGTLLVRGAGPSGFGHSWTGMHSWFGARVPLGLAAAAPGHRFFLIQGAAGSGCRSLSIQDRRRMRVLPNSGPEQDAGPSPSGHSRFGVRVPPGSGPAQDVGASAFGMQVPPGLGPEGAGPSRFRTGGGCGSLPFEMPVPPGSGPEQDADPSRFGMQVPAGSGCGSLLVQDWSRMRVPPGSGCGSLPARDRSRMRVPPS